MASAASAAQRGGVFAIDPSSATAAHAPLLHWKGVAQPARHGVSCTASSTHAAHDGGTGGTVCAIEADKAAADPNADAAPEAPEGDESK